MHEDAAKLVQGAGGRVLGDIEYPFPGTDDFSSFLVQARSSGASDSSNARVRSAWWYGPVGVRSRW